MDWDMHILGRKEKCEKINTPHLHPAIQRQAAAGGHNEGLGHPISLYYYPKNVQTAQNWNYKQIKTKYEDTVFETAKLSQLEFEV